MKPLNILTLILIIVGGLNWGLVGLFNFNLVTALFGPGGLENIVYIAVGAAAIYQLIPLIQSFNVDEPRAQSGVNTTTTTTRDRTLS
jgi:hypothetical protein